MRITCFDDLRDRAKAKTTTVAVVEAQEITTLKSVLDAGRDGIVRPIFIGDSAKIGEMLKTLNATMADYEVVDSGDAHSSLKLAVEMIHKGSAGALMKGNVESKDFLKAVIDKSNNLLTGQTLSLAGLFSLPNYHKIIAVSDMVLNTYPDLQTKKVIVENAVGMLNALGVNDPKVAVLAAVEKLNPKMPETVDADALKKMNQNGEITGCIIEGPISFDLATSHQAVSIKGYESPVAGDADLLIVPDIVSGNILVKCMTGFAGAQTAGTVLGARVPVILTSRSAESADKYYSIALAACVSGN